MSGGGADRSDHDAGQQYNDLTVWYPTISFYSIKYSFCVPLRYIISFVNKIGKMQI